LPEEILDGEIQRILNLGVRLELDTVIGRDIEVKELQSRHDVLFLGIGAQKALQLGVAGEDGPGVWSGTGYLHAVNWGLHQPCRDRMT
jgi:NADPH-dependent glutamate synthase beta subunit-like oxidoreductase|tara:strand:- start:1126 stop:1389 length:264 start_codon:yes stop_codon:yes gene_type:complete